MHYLLLVYQNEQWTDLPKAEKNRIHEECGAWHDALVKGGHSRSCMGLQPVSTATTVRQKDGKAVLIDGPFSETKEVLGGFELIECENLDQALAIAKSFPALRVGFAMEVRPAITDGRCED